MAQVKWFGNQLQGQVESVAGQRIDAACMFLSGAIKADVSQPGTLRYTPVNKNGKRSKRQKTVYNFTHSRPGNPPFKQTGEYRRSITWERNGMVGRVGTNMPLGKWLELGTGRMAPRPHIVPNFVKHLGTIRSIIGGTAQAGAASFGSNQFRSGHFGAGAREAGYE